MRTTIVMLALAMLLAPSSLFAVLQNADMDSSGIQHERAAASISVRSEGAPLDVYDGSQFLGVTPLVSVPIDTGSHILRYALHQPGAWREAAATETVIVARGDTITRAITPPVIHRISSEPFGASIYAGDSLLGSTPAILALGRDVRTLRLVKPGYGERMIAIAPESSALHVLFSPSPGGKVPGAEDILAGYTPRSNTSLYASAGVAVLSGIASAYCKVRADREYDNYQRTGDPGTLSNVRSLDRTAGFTLVLSEVSLSIFTYLLLSR